MFNNMNMNGLSDKMMNRFFRKVDNVVWDLFTGNIGVQTSEGITTIEGSGEDAQISLNLLDQFGMPVPAYAQNTPVDSVAVGDLIYANGRPKGWVVEVVPVKTVLPVKGDDDEAIEVKNTGVKRFKLMTPSGTLTTWTPPKVSMLGFDSGVMVLRSLMNMLPGGKAGVDNMSSMMMPMMMMGGGDLDLESIMPMMLFSQLGASGTGADANPMAGNNMMQMMMMMQMMGGNKGSGKRPGRKGNNFFDNE